MEDIVASVDRFLGKRASLGKSHTVGSESPSPAKPSEKGGGENTMRTEEETKGELRKIIEQYTECKDKNVTAARRLDDRGMAIAWVLGHSGIKSLVFSDRELELLSCLF